MEQVERAMSASDIRHSAEGDALSVRDLTVRQPDGSTLTTQLSFTLVRGQHLFIEGPSGIGKSTLLRAVAGIWPYGIGEIALPEGAQTLFLPQKSYLPMGTLRAAVLYPAAADAVETARIAEALAQAYLAHFIPLLDKVENWAQVLSLGEQQRLAFA